MRTEFTERPPVFEIVKTGNGMAIIRLYDNVSKESSDEVVRFTADMYEMSTKYQASLENRVSSNVTLWLNAAKEAMVRQAVTEENKDSDKLISDRIGQLEEQLKAAKILLGVE